MALPKDIRVSMVMTPCPECLPHDTTLAEAARFLVGERISGAPVVGWTGEALSVLSTTDLLRTITQELFENKIPPELGVLRSRGIGEIVQRSPVTCTPNDSLEDACALMLKHGVHRVIVVSDDSPVGVVSALDVVRVVSHVDGNVVDRASN